MHSIWFVINQPQSGGEPFLNYVNYLGSQLELYVEIYYDEAFENW